MKIEPHSIFSIKTEEQFKKIAIETFRFQAENNVIYGRYLKMMKINIGEVNDIIKIPFLPIDFFKNHEIKTSGNTSIIFTSSGTTGSIQSKHFVNDISIYEKSYTKAFELFYGDISNYCFLALLPSYLEREGSSLVYMANDLIKKSKHPKSGFYLNNTDELINTLKFLHEKQQKVILLGVSYALLDLAEKVKNEKVNSEIFQACIIIETGGMKGKRKEMIKEEMHTILKSTFQTENIHSEYGMTELLSQAYSKSNGIFHTPPWMKVMIRDINDPFSFFPENKSGGINVIDLANVYSCSFIATQDLGKKHSDGSFEILGRFDNSDIRGCNLMIQ